MNRRTIGLMISAVALGACGGDSQGALDGVDAIVFIQRPARNDGGDIFQYTSYIPGARIVKLSPPTADGEITELCCSQDSAFAAVDISGYDLSFDAREIVFSAKLSASEPYSLFVLKLDDGTVDALPTNPNFDAVNPIFLPEGKILFMTNDVVEEGALQHRDEYERGVTTQLAVINRDGTGLELGARNLSHRVFPTLLSDGRVMFTQWNHFAEINAGHLVIANPDMTTVREAFGSENTGVTNSYLKAVEIAPGRVVAIGTSRDRTLQAGALLDIRLGKTRTEGQALLADVEMSEANASAEILTPLVPLNREPSSPTIGRYYDAFPLNAKNRPEFLVSWADGPVESGQLGAGGLVADFGIFLYDSASDQRRPILNDPAMWDVFPRPLVPRDAPPTIASTISPDAGQQVLIGALNVYDSSLAQFEPGSVFAVRVIEGFSSEEGVPDDFGLTEHEGAALLGLAEVADNGAWAAKIPANIPVHQQAIDRFALALQNEPVWISGRPGESRVCGGCHEPRAGATVIPPGIPEGVDTPVDLMSTVPRDQRVSTGFGRTTTVGIPWDTAVQQVFDTHCTICHEGTPGAANPTYTISDEEGNTFTWTFDLRGGDVDIAVGDLMLSGYSRSHLSLLGPMMVDLQDAQLTVSGDFEVYVRPGEARNSPLIQKLNAPRQYPTPSLSERAFPGTPHLIEQGRPDMTADEYLLLVRMVDFGGQFFSRENAPGR